MELFSLFFPHNLSFLYRKCHWFLYVSFVSCHFGEFVHEINRFLVMSLVFSLYKIMLPANRDGFNSSFLNMVFVSWLFALVGPSRIMLSWIGKSGCPFVVSDLREVSNLLPLRMMLAVCFSFMAFILLCMFLLHLVFFVYLLWMKVEFFQMPFLCLSRSLYDFFFFLLVWLCHIYWFAYFEPSFHSRDVFSSLIWLPKYCWPHSSRTMHQKRKSNLISPFLKNYQWLAIAFRINLKPFRTSILSSLIHHLWLNQIPHTLLFKFLAFMLHHTPKEGLIYYLFSILNITLILIFSISVTVSSASAWQN